MSSVKTQSRYDASRHINYISTAEFNSAFFAYTFTGPSPANNFTGSGALSAVLNSSGVAVTATDCPAGRVLRTNGKRLYPDAAGIPVASLAEMRRYLRSTMWISLWIMWMAQQPAAQTILGVCLCTRVVM